MKIIEPSATILSYTQDLTMLIEVSGRVCYKSEDRITEGSADKFIAHLKGLHHESVLEHGSMTVKFVCDRGVSHELVRHRIASFSQESTRYCNYTKGKFGSELTVIRPNFDTWSPAMTEAWENGCKEAEVAYNNLIALGATAQEARSVLPNSLKTEVVVTANPREWRHIFKMRTAKAAHPQIREVMIPLLKEFQALWPSIYDDIKELA